MTDSNRRLPMADLLPRPITSADYVDSMPQKLELWSDEAFDAAPV